MMLVCSLPAFGCFDTSGAKLKYEMLNLKYKHGRLFFALEPGSRDELLEYLKLSDRRLQRADTSLGEDHEPAGECVLYTA